MRKGFLITCLFFLTCISNDAQDYYIRNFNADQGCPTSLVAGICEDSLGYLWVGFYNKGVYKYNGYEFVKVDFPGLNNGIIEIFHNNNNQIIAGINNNFTYICKHDSILPLYDVNDMIRSYIQLQNGDEFMGTETGRFLYYKNGKLAFNYQESGWRIGDIDKDNQNNIWFISNLNTISCFSNGIITNYNYCKNPNEQIWSVCVDDNNHVFASSLNSVKILKNGAFVDWEGSNKLLKPFANYIYRDSRNRLWFLHLDGATLYDHGKFQYLKENNFKGTALVTVYEDKNNGFWFGTTKGLIRLQNENCVLNPFSLKAEFMLKTIFKDSKGRIWTGSIMDGLLYYTNEIITTVSIPVKENIDFYNFYEDKSGNMWISTSDGVFILNDKNIKHLKRGFNIPNLPTYSIVQDRNNEIWGSNPQGVFKLNGNSYTFYQDSILSDSVENFSSINQVYADNDGEIWVLTDYNLLKWNGSGFQNVKIKSENFIGRKWGMVEDTVGNFWLATDDTGLICFNYKLNTIKYYNIHCGMVSNSIISIAKDANGNIITGSFEGLNKLELDKNGNVVQIQTYNTANGLIDDECLYKVLLCDNKNNIWFGSAMGLIKFKEPNWENLNYHIPTYITHDYANQYTNNHILELKYKNNHIRFECTGIHLNNPSSIRYSYYLEGYDINWSEPTNNRIVNYSNLRPGNYTLYVKTLLLENKLWQGENSFSFIIKAPVWYNWWFISICILLIAFIIYSLLKLWARSIKNKQIKKEDAKRKVVELELKFLRSQMNPHFMFNSINSIQNLILNEDIDQALNYLNDFGRLIRRVLNYSEKSAVTIQEELDFINEYLSLEKLRFKDKIEIHINIDPNLDTAFDRMPPMLIQPFVENAIKHGLLPKEGNGLLTIDFTANGEKLLISIIDNGVGREYHRNIKKLEKHQSKGTQMIEDHINILKKKALDDDDYQVEIIDLFDVRNNPTGTKVLIKIPLY
jgi:ligand-binding sensor domain-containing protein